MNIMARGVDLFLRAFITLVFGVLVVCVVWQVFSRYVLAAPSTVTDELARFLFIWMALVGAAYTLGRRRHLAIDLLSHALTPKMQRLTNLAITVFIAVFALLVMVYGGYQLVANTLASGQVSPALRLPMGYIYGALPLSGLVMLFYCAVFLQEILGGDGHGPNDRPTESDTTPATGALD